jgi:hypothetical protein
MSVFLFSLAVLVLMLALFASIAGDVTIFLCVE